jgi:hypothetical protein
VVGQFEHWQDGSSGFDTRIGPAKRCTGMERTSKLILAWHLGRRTAEHTLEFTEKLRTATTGRFQVTTDGSPYKEAIVYRAGSEGEGRYSPAEVVSTEVVPVSGRPDPKRICTSHVERQNLLIRMGMGSALNLGCCGFPVGCIER